MADMVARIGQLGQPYATIRDIGMMIPTKFLHSVEEQIFERTVSHSLGGTSGTLHWLPLPSWH